jgi:hypothetical protein
MLSSDGGGNHDTVVGPHGHRKVPADDAAEVATNARISVTFDRAMDPSTERNEFTRPVQPVRPSRES